MASTYSREWRAVCEKFRQAQDLSEIESRNDPENDPFRSKYKARELLKEIHCAVKNFEVDDGENEGQETDGQIGEIVDGEAINRGVNKVHAGDSTAGLRAAKLGVIAYHLGVNHIETEELSAGEEYLTNCMKSLDECTVTRENVSLTIQVLVTILFFFSIAQHSDHWLHPNLNTASLLSIQCKQKKRLSMLV